MDQPKPVLIWLNTYGGWSPIERHAIETIGLDQYLRGVVQAVSSLGNRITAIHLSGGQRDSQGRSECATFAAELRRRLDTVGAPIIPLHLDEASTNAADIAKTFLTTWQDAYGHCTPLLFTDTVRYDVNAHLLSEQAKALHITIPPTVEMLVPLDRLDIHPESTPQAQAEKLARLKHRS